VAQRSFSNDRYRKDAKIGHTRKSAAKAKPIRKQGTVEVSSSPAKPKKAGQEKDWAGLPTSPEIKKWRRIWWALLLGGLALIGVGYLVPELRENSNVQGVIAGVVLGASLLAVTIDLVVIRKLRKQLIAAQAPKKHVQKTRRTDEKTESAADAATAATDAKRGWGPWRKDRT